MAENVYTVNIRLKGLKDAPLKRAWLKKTVLAVLESEKATGPLEIDCMITDDPGIRALNRKYRGIDRATDVLSFALDEAGPADTVFAAPPGHSARMGILVISYPTALTQARENNITVENELRLLLVHGILHILGYDHGGRNEALAMHKRETQIQSLLGRTGRP